MFLMGACVYNNCVPWLSLFGTMLGIFWSYAFATCRIIGVGSIEVFLCCVQGSDLTVIYLDSFLAGWALVGTVDDISIEDFTLEGFTFFFFTIFLFFFTSTTIKSSSLPISSSFSMMSS